MNRNWLLVVGSWLLVSSCAQKKSTDQVQQESRFKTYKGELRVEADAGLESIINQEKEIFDFNYDSVHTTLTYKNEKEMLDDFRSRKTDVVVLSRKPEQSEINDFKNLDTIYLRIQPVAYDAVALIGSKDFDDKDLSMDLLKKYFAPENSSAANPKLVFENQNSSSVRFVINTLGYKEKVSPNVYALQSMQEVIDYVSRNKNVIGFIPYNAISDADDERVKKTLEQIKILSLRAKNEGGEAIRVSANQSDIATGDYPLRRTITAITRFTYEDNLEWLFINFLAREKGAKIFLKAGLIPVKIPEREIVVNESEVRGSK